MIAHADQRQVVDGLVTVDTQSSTQYAELFVVGLMSVLHEYMRALWDWQSRDRKLRKNLQTLKEFPTPLFARDRRCECNRAHIRVEVDPRSVGGPREVEVDNKLAPGVGMQLYNIHLK